MNDFSGRKFMVVFFTLTYCLAITALAVAVILGKCSLDIFLGVFTAFTAITMKIVESYFSRTDRPTEIQVPEKPILPEEKK